MGHAEILTFHTKLELAECFDEWHALDVTNGSAQLNDAHLWLRVCFDRLHGDAFNPLLYGIGDVRHHLHCFPQIIATTLLLDHLLINFARRYVVVAMQCYVKESLVVAQVQIDFAAIIEHKNFTWNPQKKEKRMNKFPDTSEFCCQTQK